MINTAAGERLEMRWVPVVDATGRSRMEAVWVGVAAAPAVAPTVLAAAPAIQAAHRAA